MSHSPQMRIDRLAAEAKYRELRNLAYEDATVELAAVGLTVELRPIEPTALVAAASWNGRRVNWPWREMAFDWRRHHTDRFELAVWSADVLCALALGRPAPSAAHMSLNYVEGNPDPDHPLRRRVTSVVITALRQYAIALDKTEMRLVDPLPEVIPHYISPQIDFTLVRPRGEKPYCTRSIYP